MGDKKSLRNNFLEERLQLRQGLKKDDHFALCVHIGNWIRLQNIKKICIFFPFKGEPDLRPLHSILGKSHIFAMPAVEGKGIMSFFQWDPLDKLVENKWGIPEPVKNINRKIIDHNQTLILVPALAIDQYGTRLGYGGGFYDKYLNKYTPSFTVGVLWEQFFVAEELPKDSWDMRIKYIGTQFGVKALF